MSKVTDRQKLIRMYRLETGNAELDMREVARFALARGYPMPKPRDPLEMLAEQFKEAARQEVRKDDGSGHPYRAYHAVPAFDEKGQGVFFWVDIDDPDTTHSNMRKSMVRRREQMVDDGVQLTLDLEHWNSKRSEQEHITFPMDLEPDIAWRMSAMDDDDDKKAA